MDKKSQEILDSIRYNNTEDFKDSYAIKARVCILG